MFFENIDRFRGVAIVGIVGAHTLQNFTWEQSGLVFDILNTLTNQSSIWFFFIAGFLFQHLSYRYAPKGYLAKKFANVILPYLFCSIPALLATYLLAQNNIPPVMADYPIPAQIALLLLTGGQLAPFWFVPTISILYLLAPVFLKGVQTGWLFRLLPLLLLASLVLGREGIQFLTGWGMFAGPLSKAIYLVSAYIFGMFFCSRYESAMLLSRRYWLVLLLASFVFATLAALDSYRWFHPIFAFKIASAPLLLLALDRVPPLSHHPLATLGDYSFGIFFLHGYILAAGKLLVSGDFYTPLAVEGNALYWLILVALTTSLCVVGLMTARRILKGRSRQFFGA